MKTKIQALPLTLTVLSLVISACLWLSSYRARAQQVASNDPMLVASSNNQVIILNSFGQPVAWLSPTNIIASNLFTGTLTATNGVISTMGTNGVINIWTNIAGSGAISFWTNYTGYSGFAIVGGGIVTNLWLGATSINPNTNSATSSIYMAPGAWLGVGYTAAPKMSWTYQ